MKKLARNARGFLRAAKRFAQTRYSRSLMRHTYAKGTLPPSQPMRVLFWVPGGMPSMLDVEGAVAGGLISRGANVSAVICNGAYRACVRRDVRDRRPISEWSRDCHDCTQATSSALERLAIPYAYIGDFVAEDVRKRLFELSRTVTWEGLDGLRYRSINVGNNVRSAIIRYLQGHDYRDQVELVQEYAYSALICAEAAAAAYDKLQPDKVFMSHGVYVDWGPALHTALQRSIDVVAWMASYLKSHFYFRRIEDGVRIDFHNMSGSAWERWRTVPLSTAQKGMLDRFLADRYLKRTGFDMKQLKTYSGDAAKIRARYALPEDKPMWGILAHINWDTVSDYAPMAYASFNDWIADTVREISRIPDVTWIIKVHPAESWDNPDSGVEKLLANRFGSLPGHVRVFSADADISPLDFFKLVDGGITVYGTGGLELALLGKPVICAGEAHYGGKGFTYDALTIPSYQEMLRQVPGIGPLDEAEKTLAQRYAFVYFMRRQIPLSVVDDPASDWWRFRLDRRDRLLPHRDPYLDFICERIAEGGDFILEDSLIAHAYGRARAGEEAFNASTAGIQIVRNA